MKLFDFDKRHLFFVVIFFVVLIIDFTFFVGLKVPEFLPGEFLTGVIFMIGFFVIIPIAVAYQISFKLRKNSSKELEIKKINKKLVIVISILLALFVFLIIPKGPVKFEPYTFYPVTDQEFKKPLKIIATKKIGENEYYLRETEKVGVSLYQKLTDDKQDDKFIFDLAVYPKVVTDFWYDSSINAVFVIESRNSFESYPPLEQIFKFSNDLGEQPDLNMYSLGIYSFGNKILDYFPETNTLLMGSLGGSRGSIWSLMGTKVQMLQELYTRIRFVGYDSKFLYFAFFDSAQRMFPDYQLKEIFKINPRTIGKESIINTDLPENIVQVRLSEDNKNIVMVTDKGKNIILNLELNSINKEASPSAGN